MKNNMSKKIIIIVAVVIIIVALVCYSQITPVDNTTDTVDTVNILDTPTPLVNLVEMDISDWKTYKNEDYGFKFQYPKDWNISLDKGFNYTITVKSSDKEYVHLFLVKDRDNGPGPTLAAYKDRFKNQDKYCMQENSFPPEDHPYLNEINYGVYTTSRFACKKINLATMFYELKIEQPRKEITITAGHVEPSDKPNNIELEKKALIGIQKDDLIGIVVSSSRLSPYISLFTSKGGYDPVSKKGQEKLSKIKEELGGDQIIDIETSTCISYFDTIISTFKIID